MSRKCAALAATSLLCGLQTKMTPTEMAAGRFLRAPDHDGSTGGGAKSAADLAAEVKAGFEKSLDTVKGIAEEALGKAKSGEALSASMKEKADEALTKMNGLKEQLDQLEQRIDRDGDGGRPEAAKSIGERFVENDDVKAWCEGGPSKGKVDMRMKATITSATTDADGSAGAGVPTTRLPGVQELPQRRLTVRDLISPGTMDTNSLEYVRETGFTNNAGMVAEGGLKPSSDLKFDLVTTSAKVIAHWFKASRQILDDFSQLRSIIDQRLTYGLAYKEEGQLLFGDGTGQNLHGIVPQASEFDPAFAPAGATSIDTLRLAQLQAALAEFPATGQVLNPVDWAAIELTKDGEGRYIIGNPQGSLSPALWGLPVVDTPAMTQGRFLVGAFRLGAQYFERWDARVELGFVDDDFIRNLVTLLGEQRGALAVYRPEAFITGDIAAVTESEGPGEG